MKHILLALTFLLSFAAHSQNEFITTWQVSGSDLTIQIPTDQFDFTYDYTVDFGDGTVLNNQTENASHTYASAGTYTVLISGTFPKFNGSGLFDNEELITVEQWGDNQWASMEGAFEDCFNLTINASDSPDLSNVTDMSFMFASADLVNPTTISNWDVSNVTKMEGVFANADSFNQPLDNWDVSNVTHMENMFFGTNAFNQPLNDWDVSSVTSMFRMFANSLAFNQPLTNWNVSNVTDMGEMFKQSNFNQPLGDWNTSSVTTMREMFRDCPYNHPLNS
ncbi:MAG TPA: BspA family leucine-rich repeat surface protein, partial [Cryomorphaceae bacterium]|nr:BspA family leucine-rich repeat surface protein [Cryomorphaceae bacterium]